MTINLKNFDSFVEVDELFSGSFTYDFYIRSLRRLVKELANNGFVGTVKMVPLEVANREPSRLAILLGDSNRARYRYPYIETLLYGLSSSEKNEKRKLMLQESDYFNYLFMRYASLGYVERMRGKRNCLIKVKRIIELSEYFTKNKSFKGFNSSENVVSLLDFPLVLELPGSFLELDGSHRRCIAYFYGSRKIESNVVKLADLVKIFREDINSKSYFSKHWPKFINIIGLSTDYNLDY